MPRRLLAPVAALITAGLALTVVQALPASASVRMCAQYSAKILTGRVGTKVEARNDWWLEPGCITTDNSWPAFKVSSSFRPAPSGRVDGFPEILRGCQYGSCTPASGFPRRVSATGDAVARWSTRGNWAGGVHNTAFDVWFGKSANYAGHAAGTEIMIWLNSHNLGHPYRAPKMWIDGRPWWLSYWRTCEPGTTTCWNYVRFWAVHQIRSVSWLKLHPFMRKAIQIGKLRSGWWLWNVEAGYEIWSGGNGLQTTNFWARA